MHAVNLVPEHVVVTQHRRRRIRWWMAAAALAGLAASIALGRLFVLDQLARRTEAELVRRRAQETELLRRIADARGAQNEAAEQARAVAGLHRAHPLPANLLKLFVEVPPGVVLQDIEAAAPTVKQGAPHVAPAAGATRRIDAPLRLRVRGHAIAQADIDALIGAIEAKTMWGRVRLVRLQQDRYLGGEVAAFELECRAREEQP